MPRWRCAECYRLIADDLRTRPDRGREPSRPGRPAVLGLSGSRRCVPRSAGSTGRLARRSTMTWSASSSRAGAEPAWADRHHRAPHRRGELEDEGLAGRIGVAQRDHPPTSQPEMGAPHCQDAQPGGADLPARLSAVPACRRTAGRRSLQCHRCRRAAWTPDVPVRNARRCRRPCAVAACLDHRNRWR
jgi:hypothetical protein